VQTPGELGTSVARLVAQVMVADLCYLISVPESNGQVTLETGYDLIREESLEGRTLSVQHIPQISSALQKRPLAALERGFGDYGLAQSGKLGWVEPHR